MDFTIEQIALFALYTIVAFGAAVVNRMHTNNKGESIKNETVGAMNDIAKDALTDLRVATQALIKEGEKRARLEGQVKQLIGQLKNERDLGDKARAHSKSQDDQITKLHNQVRGMEDKFEQMQFSLDKVKREKAKLIEEKEALEIRLSDLMASVQERIDDAISATREEMKQHYEEKIARLDERIQEKEKEIERLKAKLQEEPSNETPNTHNHADATATAPDPSSNQ